MPEAGYANRRQRPSSPALTPFVSALGVFAGDFPHRREIALPTGGVQLLVNLDADRLHMIRDGQPDGVPGAALQGPWDRPVVIDPADQRAIVWVAFRPGGAYPFMGPDVGATGGALVELSELWGGDGATLRERLLHAGDPAAVLRAMERVLLTRAASSLTADPAVTWAATALDRGAAVADVADRLGWTPRRLARRFAERVGLPPKRYARVRRFQRVLRHVTADPAAGWARVAADCGFHDQAHLIHDFREFAGTTPARYAPRSPADRNHVPVVG
jgi:AraC-like DNA-binding protein